MGRRQQSPHGKAQRSAGPVESGACLSDTRACSPLDVNATTGVQTWTGSAYGSCTATACASGYSLNTGAYLL